MLGRSLRYTVCVGQKLPIIHTILKSPEKTISFFFFLIYVYGEEARAHRDPDGHWIPRAGVPGSYK